MTIIKGSRNEQEQSSATSHQAQKHAGGIIKKGNMIDMPSPAQVQEEEEQPDENEVVAEVEEEPSAEEHEEPEESNIVHIPTGAPKKEPPKPKIQEAPQPPPPPPTPPPPPVDKVLIEEAERKAAQIVKEAQAEAKKLLEESKLYCQSAFSQSEREGFEVGRLAGIEAGKEELRSLIESGKSLINQTLKERQKLLKSCEPELAHLALKIAEKIINTEVDQNPDVVVETVRGALEKIKNREEVTIRVNPEDLDEARRNKDVFEKLIEGLKSLDILEDQKVERGGCIIETNLGNVDARLSTQLAALEIAFKDADAATDYED